jgi:superfamily II DNA or RNA helicase
MPVINKLRKYQTEAIDAIREELITNDAKKCLVKMFCGTGKSAIMRNMLNCFNASLVVYVFPSLSLISQFTHDYLKGQNNILKISSDDESTTEPSVICNFLEQTFNKIICVTYQSFATLIENLDGLVIDVCIFDEAHHAVGQTYQQLIFKNSEHTCKQIFFTATPKNANGITMYEKDVIADCGKMVYDYTYYKGISEGYLNPFEIRIDFYSEHNNHSIYESICRAILASGNNRVLTFHSDVNTDRDTSVNNFVNQLDLNNAFQKIINSEFSDKIGFYKKYKIVGLSSDIIATCTQCLEKIKKCSHRPVAKSCCRYNILENFDKTKDDEILIISSCETIGEGIDTKNANMCVFVDPKSSYVSIMQNIGRIVRKNGERPLSTILIPCWVDREKYLNCNGDKEKCDEVIREDLGAQGNFNSILNVMSALRQEDEELYDICLHYPDTYSPQEIESNLKNQGFVIKEAIGEGNLIENVEYLLDKEIDYEEYEDLTEEEMLMQIANDNGVNIEVHTNSLEMPIEKYISEDMSEDENEDEEKPIKPQAKKTIRLYKTIDEETEEPIYSPIVEKKGEIEKKQSIKQVSEPNRNKRVKVDVHTNPDIKVLWNISNNVSGLKDVCSCILDCEVVDNWYERLEELKNFMDENMKRPNKESKNDYEKSIGRWVSHQISNHKNKKQSMKIKEKYESFSQFLKDYKEYFKSINDIWYEIFDKVKKFINEIKRRPTIASKNENEKKLGKWLDHQIQNYKKINNSMKNIEKYNLWTQFLKDYEEYFKSYDEIWYEIFEELNIFIKNNKRRPNKRSKNENEKKIGNWVSIQNQNYKTKTKSMLDTIKYDLWTQFLKDYKEYFKSNDEIWYEIFEEVKKFIDEREIRPNIKSKNDNETKLCMWISNQSKNYKTKKNSMKDLQKYNLWTQFLEDYKEYFKSLDEIWYENFEKLKQFINENGKKPGQTSHDKKEVYISKWMGTQIQNYKTEDQSMSNTKKYNLWKRFLEDYKEYLKSFDDIWYDNFEKLKTFINENGKRPNINSEKTLTNWLQDQNKKYKNKKESMKDPEKYELWKQFLEDYKEYFISNDEIWYEIFEELKIFMNENKKRPLEQSQNTNEKKLGRWLSTQNTNYKIKKNSMKDLQKYNLWTKFLDDYKEYFKTNDEIWYETLEELKCFIDVNNRKPNIKNECEIKLYNWIGTQNKNYKIKKNAMYDENKYKLWTNFLEEYNEHFKLINDVWYENFEELKCFIKVKNRKPNIKNECETKLYNWIGTQNKNYKTEKNSMKDPEKYDLWSNFLIENEAILNLKEDIIDYSVVEEEEQYEEIKLTSKKNINTEQKQQHTKDNKKEEESDEEELTFDVKPESEKVKVKKEEHESEDEEEFTFDIPKKSAELQRQKIWPTKPKNTQQQTTNTFRTECELTKYHRKYITMRSDNLAKHFKANHNEFMEYHRIRDENLETFDTHDRPHEKIIAELNKIKTKRQKIVVDMGCGTGKIAEHFKNDMRFQFINYDHVSTSENIIECDISCMPLEEYSVELCIMSMALWGSNCEEYIREAHRVLETGGKLYIVDSTKRWSDTDENGIIVEGTECNRLKNILIETGFQMINQCVDKWCLFVCSK